MPCYTDAFVWQVSGSASSMTRLSSNLMWQLKHLISALPGSFVNVIICTHRWKACDEEMSVKPRNVVTNVLRPLGVYIQFKFGVVPRLPEHHADAEDATFLLLCIAWTCCHSVFKHLVFFQILKLLESPQGVIPPGGVAGLNFIFSPLEDRVYNVALPIKLGNGAKTALHLVGNGYHPLPAVADSAGMQQRLGTDSTLCTLWDTQIEAAADKATWLGFSAVSHVQLPRQLLSLSHGLVSFGPVSIQAVSKRVVAVMAGDDFGVTFDWALDVLAQERGLLDGSLQIEPSSGTLPPNGCCLCRLTFTAGLNPQLFEAGIRCHVSPIAEPLSPLQPTRVPSLNSPLNSPRTAGSASSRSDSAQKLAGNQGTAQHGRRSPRMATSPRKASSRAESGLAGAPVRQKSPTKDKSCASPSKSSASQNRAPVSRTSSMHSSGGQKVLSPPKSPAKSTGKTAKAPSPVKAAGKAGSAASVGRASSSVASRAKPLATSPHKNRRESGHFPVILISMCKHGNIIRSMMHVCTVQLHWPSVPDNVHVITAERRCMHAQAICTLVHLVVLQPPTLTIQ